MLTFAGCADIEIPDDSGGCVDGQCPNKQALPPEVPVVNLPLDLRHQNYAGGSCVHASFESIVEWQGQHALAQWWRSHYSGGESYNGLTSKMTANGIQYAATHTGDIEFLKKCSLARLGAVIFYYPNHSISLVEFNDHEAVVLDNNRTKSYIHIPHDEFVRAWRGYGGVAMTPLVASPAIPLPYVD